MNNTDTKLIDQVLSELDVDHQEGPGQWMAHCPAHDDNTASLAVGEGGPDQKPVLLYCYAGCSFKDIAAELDCMDRQWKPWHGDEVGRYSYVDESGAVLFDVVRFEMRDPSHPAYGEKKFVQQGYVPDHADAGEKGCPEGYVWGRKGHDIDPVLYRLPDVKDAASEARTVFVVEGEQDVHTVERWDLVATTNPQGADSWKRAYGDMLEGAHVVILPDNDDPGRDHANTIAGSVYGKAESVRIVQLPGLDEGEDVTDWAEQGGTAEKLKKIASRTDPLKDPMGELSVNGHSNEGQTDKKDKKDKKDTGHDSEPPPFPGEVFDHAPATIRNITAYLSEQHERDVVFMSLLPVCAGAMPNVRFRYGGQWLSLNLYAAAVAPPGSGKGKMRVAKQAGRALDERLYQDSRRAIEQWEERQDVEGENPGPRPEERALFLPGDTSAAQMKHSLQANPHGVLFETEFKTVGTALTQDWGQFRDVLLKGAHNEPVTVARRGEDMLRIGHPAPSVALSGTPSTFTEVIEDVSDGLFSRFLLYQFESDPEWTPQFQDADDMKLDAAIEEAQTRLNSIHKALTSREEPLYVTFPENRQGQHTDAMKAILGELKKAGVDESLYPSVKRSGLIALRIAGIFALLRLHENGSSLSDPKSVEISEADLSAGLYAAATGLAHAIEIANELKMEDTTKGLHAGQVEYLNALPTGSFTTAEANAIASDRGIGERKAGRWRKRFVDKDLIEDAGHGEWRRHPGEGSAAGVDLHAPLSDIFTGTLDTTRPTEAAEDSAPF